MKKYEIYLPLKYNDGTEVEPEKVDQIRERLVAVFGAVTVSPVSRFKFALCPALIASVMAQRFFFFTQSEPKGEKMKSIAKKITILGFAWVIGLLIAE